MIQPGRLHIITNTRLQHRFSHYELAKMAFDAGAPVVQYRDKSFHPKKDLPALLQLSNIPRKGSQKLIVNDSAAIAHQVNADGCHLGRKDGSPSIARELLGKGAIIGATVHSEEELSNLITRKCPVNYIGVGPVFGTISKSGLMPMGLEMLKKICKLSPFPVIAIGGITLSNASKVLHAGAYGMAVLSAFCCAKEPQNVVEGFLSTLP